MRTFRVARSAGALACLALLAGCIQMPTSGPVVPSQVSTEVDDVPGISFDPRPPRPGETSSEIVAGFLEAMKATPIRTTVARQFLSGAAQEAWAPERQIITYAELGDPDGSSSVRLQLTDVNLYDARGTWDRTLPARQLGLTLVQEGGEWRIDQLPDALIVPDSWFEDWYQRVSLYFFDPTTEVLVPEPVFAPRGEQLASALVRGLLTSPDGESSQVARTFFPPGTTLGLSVPISTAGIADVSLSGDPDAIDQETADRMLAQLAWTLQQEPLIRAFELSVGGRTFASSAGGSTQVNLDVGRAYDPSGFDSTGELFALDSGRLVRGAIGAFEETLGPMGQVDLGLRSMGVNIAGTRVAAVSGDGTEVLLGQVEVVDGRVERVVRGAMDLQAPVWDYRDRVWVLDRNGGRARVLLVVDGGVREVTVPGVSRRTVREILVSRDGSRLVAVERGRSRDKVVVLRIQHDDTGRVLSLTGPQELPLPVEGIARIRDVGWRSPTTVSVLSDFNEDISQVRTFSVDGSPAEIVTGGTSRLRGRTRRLVSVPLEGSDVYALAGRSVTDLTRLERTVPDLPRGLTGLTFAG
ncbi:MAG: LpqB family beta-propeller domain-containing protein [Nocardioides sp.]|nr:LpqB family beta-propeller domain-containing protein [Nocardioides sp.]